MITYRLATKEDNRQLLDLTAAVGMMGDTGLRIDRSPDFFGLLEMRGETKTFLALDGDKVIGCLCVSLQQVYVGGQVFPLRYIGDFKVADAYRNKGIGMQLCNNMAEYVISEGSDLAFLNVSKGNSKPISFFSNGPGVPDFDNIGIFVIHQFIATRKKMKDPRCPVTITMATAEVTGFFDHHYRKYQLGPVITKEQLEGTTIAVIRDDTGIVAAISMADLMPVKQNVVTRLSWKMKALLTIINTFSPMAGISKMPVLHEPVRMMYIKYLAIARPEKKLVKLLLNHAKNVAYEKGYSFISIGLHEKDPLNDQFSGLFKLSFRSVGMLISIKNNRSLIEKVKQGIPFEDYSLV